MNGKWNLKGLQPGKDNGKLETMQELVSRTITNLPRPLKKNKEQHPSTIWHVESSLLLYFTELKLIHELCKYFNLKTIQRTAAAG